MKSILPQIELLIVGQNFSYRKVAKFLIAHKDKASFYTLDDLSRHIGVSTTTVLRFARSLGFKGYKDFQYQLQTELLNKISSYSTYTKLENNYKFAEHNDLLSDVVAKDLNNIKQTINQLDRKALQQAVDLIWTAKNNIYFGGMGSSYAMAYLAFTRLIPLKTNMFLFHPDIGEIIDPLLNVTEHDICLFFIFHRYNTRSIQILKELNRKNAKIILITDTPYDTVSKYVTVILPCLVDSAAPKNSLVSAVCLINYLCAAIAFKDYKGSLEKYASSSEIHDRNNLTAE